MFVSLQHQTTIRIIKMKTLKCSDGANIKIKTVYEKGHKFYGKVFYYVEGVKSGYRHSIENVNKHLKEEDKIKLPE